MMNLIERYLDWHYEWSQSTAAEVLAYILFLVPLATLAVVLLLSLFERA